jgi:import inner membrane translocase subunit TIM8
MDQQLDVSKLSDADKKELNQFLTNEAQKSTIQQSECRLSPVAPV